MLKYTKYIYMLKEHALSSLWDRVMYYINRLKDSLTDIQNEGERKELCSNG